MEDKNTNLDYKKEIEELKKTVQKLETKIQQLEEEQIDLQDYIDDIDDDLDDHDDSLENLTVLMAVVQKVLQDFEKSFREYHIATAKNNVMFSSNLSALYTFLSREGCLDKRCYAMLVMDAIEKTLETYRKEGIDLDPDNELINSFKEKFAKADEKAKGKNKKIKRKGLIEVKPKKSHSSKDNSKDDSKDNLKDSSKNDFFNSSSKKDAENDEFFKSTIEKMISFVNDLAKKQDDKALEEMKDNSSVTSRRKDKKSNIIDLSTFRKEKDD